MNNKISILLLDDLVEHFEVMKSIISDILMKNCELEASFIFTPNEGRDIISFYQKSMFGGSENVKKRNLDELRRRLNKIDINNSIAVIDINWKSESSSNKDGRYFYDKYLTNMIFPNNTIFVSFIEETELEDEVLGYQFVPKIWKGENGNKVELGKVFETEMKKAICRTQLVVKGVKFANKILIEIERIRDWKYSHTNVKEITKHDFNEILDIINSNSILYINNKQLIDDLINLRNPSQLILSKFIKTYKNIANNGNE